jgi:hypothetical protein
LQLLFTANRHLGVSDGPPRQEVEPYHQQLGYPDAFNYAKSLPDVDANRIAFWGLCAAMPWEELTTALFGLVHYSC